MAFLFLFLFSPKSYSSLKERSLFTFSLCGRQDVLNLKSNSQKTYQTSDQTVVGF